jgi:hypothetical protein
VRCTNRRLHAASERVERVFAAQVAQVARLRGQGGGDGDQARRPWLEMGKWVCSWVIWMWREDNLDSPVKSSWPGPDMLTQSR